MAKLPPPPPEEEEKEDWLAEAVEQLLQAAAAGVGVHLS